MSDYLKLAIAPCSKEPIHCIAKAYASEASDPCECGVYLHAGVFFDGTGNNRDADKPERKHSNVARLADAYQEKISAGFFRYYLPGVGTPFPEIGEQGESALGKGFAYGCEERVLFALLSLFNAIHERAFRMPFFYPSTLAALSRNGLLVRKEDSETLAALGEREGLCQGELGNGHREMFLRTQSMILANKLKQSNLVIKEFFVDVFGFSRGAAEARVFCQWLSSILSVGKLAGIPVRLGFLGLFDTVASAGLSSSVGAAITGSPSGHDGWAATKHLLIPDFVENCVHMVAMHELRRNFPLDEIGIHGTIPLSCQQYAYPGSHSDVGGGYAPGELGISKGNSLEHGDSLKLSQIPLNHMLKCALAAGVL